MFIDYAMMFLDMESFEADTPVTPSEKRGLKWMLQKREKLRKTMGLEKEQEEDWDSSENNYEANKS